MTPSLVVMEMMFSWAMVATISLKVEIYRILLMEEPETIHYLADGEWTPISSIVEVVKILFAKLILVMQMSYSLAQGLQRVT